MKPAPDYISTLINFVQKLEEDQRKIRSGSSVHYETGRKYDKILINGGVRYFVFRENGSIYGAKSRLAPNLRWYFGTIENCEKWDWSGYHGKPVTDDTVIITKGYGNYEHYIKIK